MNLTILSFVAACAGTEPGVPGPIQGMFALETIGGDPLPAHERVFAGGVLIAAETLYFDISTPQEALPRYRQKLTTATPEQTAEFLWSYSLAGTAVTLPPPPCNDTPTYACIWSYPEGRLEGDSLVISFLDQNTREKVYRRVQ